MAVLVPAPDAVLLLRPHAGYPRQPDRHGFHELIVVVRGTYRAATDDGRLRLAVGGAVLYPARFGHRPLRDADESTFFCIQWPASAHDLGDRALVVPGPAQRLAMAAGWLHELVLRSPRSPDAEAGLLRALVDEVRAQAGATAAEAEPDDGIATVRRVLRDNYFNQHALADLAAMAGLGPRQLDRRFRARYGCLPLEYLRRLRVEAATAMLVGRQGTCEEIARACGFGRASYLSRVLRADTGLSPRAIREGGRPG